MTPTLTKEEQRHFDQEKPYAMSWVRLLGLEGVEIQPHGGGPAVPLVARGVTLVATDGPRGPVNIGLGGATVHHAMHWLRRRLVALCPHYNIHLPRDGMLVRYPYAGRTQKPRFYYVHVLATPHSWGHVSAATFEASVWTSTTASHRERRSLEAWLRMMATHGHHLEILDEGRG